MPLPRCRAYNARAVLRAPRAAGRPRCNAAASTTRCEVTGLRRQLTLFVPNQESGPIETLRRRLDPVQHALIRAHVTLCREHELADAAGFVEHLQRATPGALTLTFGPPERFAEHGVLLPCTGGAPAVEQVRRFVLGSPAARGVTPHISLAHPRNPRAPANGGGPLPKVAAGFAFTFTSVALIEQVASSPWRVVAAFPLPSLAGGPHR